MLKFPKSLILVTAALFVAEMANAQSLGLGRAATADEVAAWNTDIRPDGQGLPVGSGSVLDGEEVFVEQCAVCHGDFGEGVDRWPVLAGGQGSLESDRPVKTIGSYWPYLSTVWDYIHRAMPFGNARSISDDDIYAITAYLLYMNDIVDDEDFVLSNENFLEIKMPNADGFYMDDREESPIFTNREACMSDCKEDVHITMNAQVLDVTPNEEGSEEVVIEEVVVIVDPELIAAGEKVFKKCKACHQIGEGARNRTGPILTGIVGTLAAQTEDFRYSGPMSEAGEAGLIWTPEELTAFLTKPRDYMRGTRMTFNGLRKEEDIAAVIAYLQSVSE